MGDDPSDYEVGYCKPPEGKPFTSDDERRGQPFTSETAREAAEKAHQAKRRNQLEALGIDVDSLPGWQEEEGDGR